TVLTGFTVTGGYVTGGFPTGYGGGIHCSEAEPTITNCIVYGNSASTGGGMYCADGSPKLLSCTFSGNSASISGGGIFTHYDSFPTLINSTFSGNSAGIGGGIDVFYGCPIVLINCTFSNNTATDNGGGICISDHSLFGGGGPSILTNCTFSGNTASGNGGAIYCSEAAELTNCILWGNSPQQMYVDGTGPLSAAYSDVQGGWPGEGNISVNPNFAANYHLQSDSPCRNAGDPEFVPDPGVKDTDGEPRVMGSRVDMGVDEYAENIRPIADAGQDQSMSDMPPQVTLDGSGSSDPTGDPLSYHWSQTFGPEVEIDDANSAITTFSPAEYGGYIFELVVNDGFLDSFADSVNIVVGSGHIPVADAGLPRYAATDPVELDGTASYDPDNSGPLSYQWQQISGPNLTIVGADTPTPTISGFTPTGSIRRCEFELIVSDGQYESLPGTVFVIIVHNRYSESSFRLETDTFDPEKPTIIHFGRGGSWDGGPDWDSRANILSDVTDTRRDYFRDGDNLIVYLSSVAPDYKQPIQVSGVCGGTIAAIEVAGYMNRTYQDRRYAVNHVAFFASNASMSLISRFLASRVDREQCWVDSYLDESQHFLPCLNVKLPASIGHGGGRGWYKNSLTYSDLNQFTSPVAGPGVIGGAYWSVIGPGRNLQLALTPYTETYRFKWDGSMTSGYMDFYDEFLYPGRLPEPVTLIDPLAAGTTDPNAPVVFTCEESENAVGYEL
ncbi:MAG: PKD domain-containing protein, partial [Planctomycetota bacterium]